MYTFAHFYPFVMQELLWHGTCDNCCAVAGWSNGSQCIASLPAQVYHDVTLPTYLVAARVFHPSLSCDIVVLFILMLQLLQPRGEISAIDRANVGNKFSY